MRIEWWFTHLGDMLVASAVAGVMVIWMWLNLNRLKASIFGICFSGTFGTVTLIKLWTSANLPQPDQVSLWAPSAGAPSGHSALAGFVYGCGALVFLRLGRGAMAALGVIGGTLALALVAITRVTLHTHTITDVLAGLAIAVVFVAIFNRALGAPEPAPPIRLSILAVAMIAVAAVAIRSHLRLSSDLFL